MRFYKEETTIEINKIHNEDCIKGMKKIPDKSIDMILTDIPYGGVSAKGAARAKYAGQLRKIDKGAADIVTFDLNEFVNECARVTKGSIYIFCGIAQVYEIYKIFDAHPDYMVRQCAWKKTNPPPTNGQHMWLSSMENCIFAKRRKTLFNASCQSSVWENPIGSSKVHPTQKPLSLFKKLILASTNENDIVLDPCIGSGTTAVACIETNRKYLGFEIKNEYYEITQNRIQAELSAG